MRGWTSSMAGAVCVGAAMWMLAQGHSDKTVLLLAGAALVLFFRGYQGLTLGEAANDAMLAANFVADPKRGAMNFAVDRMDKIIDAEDDAEENHRFDAEKIIDRYLEERAKNPPPGAPAPSSAPAGFGRKGL